MFQFTTPDKEPLVGGRALWISGLVVILARLAQCDSGLGAVPSASDHFAAEPADSR